MVLEVYDEPGTETYRSALYTVTTEDGSGPYVYGVTRNAKWASKIAAAGAPITMSWVTIGTETTTSITVTRAAGAITSLIVYPLHIGIDYDISGSTVTLEVPTETNLVLEFNGEQAKPLMIFAGALKTAVDDGNPVDTFTNLETFPAALTGRTLYFGPGVWTIDQLYDVPTGARVYLDGGAWVIGSFDVRNSDNFTIEGPGILSGEWEDGLALDRTQPFDDLALYSLILGYDGSDYLYSNTQVRDITMVSSPFYHIADGVNYCVNVKMLTPWWENTDGIGVMPDQSDAGVGQGSRATASGNFFYIGDDAIKIISNAGDYTADGNFCVNTAASAILLLYRSDASLPGETTITNTTIVSKASDYFPSGTNGPNSASSIKLWIDGVEGATNARRDVTIEVVKVEGPGTTPLFTIENNLYPWGAQNDAFGQAYDITIADVTMASDPGERSRLYGRDATNTPHDLTFTDIYIAGTLVHEGNWDTYVDQNEFPYDITLDADPADPGDSTFVVEDGTGLATANTYCTVEDADLYHENQGDPAAWTAATTNEKREALRIATTFLDYHYGSRWAGVRGSSEQALDWPRSWATDSAGNAIDSDTVPLRLEQACAVAALLHVQGSVLLPQTQTTAGIASESNTVGAVTRQVTYRGSKPASALFPIIERMMATAGLLTSNGYGWGVVLG